MTPGLIADLQTYLGRLTEEGLEHGWRADWLDRLIDELGAAAESVAAHPCSCLACVQDRQAALAAAYAIDDRVIGIRRRTEA